MSFEIDLAWFDVSDRRNIIPLADLTITTYTLRSNTDTPQCPICGNSTHLTQDPDYNDPDILCYACLDCPIESSDL